ncbi:Membrane-bound metal-dependent hydrolase [Desulfosarcina cetonica]|uniref:metal-dependent hydrolase n=1 Tax=Desulfosarcina cetonica TaxID=90730 RepID=UPI0006CFA137|nr:metal-dependent hydrolase [Desulfosarcina cetonica]VTR67975.1 Membrane-bound metal-dependent hydrolase [Desulfosarcina cetonica]
MPGYKGHISGSMVAGGVTAAAALICGYHFAVTPARVAGLVGFCLLGGLFPDVDTDSKGQNLFYSLLIVVDGVLIYYHQYTWAAWLGLCAMLPALGHHRGWTHTWWAMIVTGVPIIVIPIAVLGRGIVADYLPFYLAFTVGYFSHLLLDGKFA